MTQIRNYELVTEIESSSPPTISPLAVGDAQSATDALSLQGMENLGLGTPAIAVAVASLAALKALSADLIGLMADGCLILRRDTGQVYRLAQGSTLVSNDHNIVTPTNSTGDRWVQVELPRYVSSDSAGRAILDQDGLVLADATGGSLTFTLPTAVGRVGKTFFFKKTDSSVNSVIIDPAGAELINGAANFSFNRQNRVVGIISNGTAWHLLHSYSPLLEDNDHTINRSGQTLLDLNSSATQVDIAFKTSTVLRGTLTVDQANGRLSFLSGTTTGTKQALLSLSDGTNTTTLGNENNVTPDYRLRWAGDTYLNSDRSTYTVGRVNGEEDLSLFAGTAKQLLFSSGGNSAGYVDSNQVWTIGRNQTSTSLSAHVVRNYSTASIPAILQVIGLGTAGNVYAGTATKFSIMGYGASAWRLRMGTANDTVTSVDDPDTTVTFGSLNTALDSKLYAGAAKKITFFTNAVEAGSISSGNTWTIGNTAASSNNVIQSNVSTPLFLNTATGAAYCGLQFAINSVAKGTIQAPTAGGFCFFGTSTTNENAEMSNDGTFSLGSDATGNVTSAGTHQIFSTSTNVLDVVNGASSDVLIRARYNNGSGGTISDLGRISFIEGTNDATRYADFRLGDTASNTLRQVFSQAVDGNGGLYGYQSGVVTVATWNNVGIFTFGSSATTTNAPHTFYHHTSAAARSAMDIAKSNMADNTANNVYLRFNNATAFDGFIQNDGSGNLAIVQPSDICLKEKIYDADFGLKEVLNLRPVNFTWKSNGVKNRGFIAQEMKEVIPEAVTMNEGIYSISTTYLIPFLVQSIKELNAKIEELKK